MFIKRLRVRKGWTDCCKAIASKSRVINGHILGASIRGRFNGFFLSIDEFVGGIADWIEWNSDGLSGTPDDDSDDNSDEDIDEDIEAIFDYLCLQSSRLKWFVSDISIKNSDKNPNKPVIKRLYKWKLNFKAKHAVI